MKFSSIECLKELDAAQQLLLIDACEQHVVRSGEILMHEGAPSESMYFVKSGRFAVTISNDEPKSSGVDTEIVVGEIGPDETVGEIGFLSGATRIATVTAIRDSLVLRLKREQYDCLCLAAPRLLQDISSSLASKLSAANYYVKKQFYIMPRTVFLCPAGNSQIDPEFISRFLLALSLHGTCVVLDRRSVELEFRDKSIDSDEVTVWLNQQEQQFDFVIYVSTIEDTEWAATCLRQSEKIFLVADSEIENPVNTKPNAVEQCFANASGAIEKSLILVHPHIQRYDNTRLWLQDREVLLGHHVALDQPTHFSRLARFICGQATGLVASGGGAYAAAHIGVAKAMLEAGIGFDMIGGTSGGAAMAFSWPMGYSPEAMSERVEQTMVRSGALRKFTLPVYGLVNHRYFDQCLQQQYGGNNIEDLWLNFFTVSSNLSNGKLHVHRHGDVWRAIRASSSIPGLLPPVVTEDGELLVDGGIIDNTPVSTMKRLKTGPNIVVCFEPKHQNRTKVAYEELPGIGEMLLELLKLKKSSHRSSMPGIGSVLTQSMLLDNHSLDEVTDQDLVLRLSLPKDIKLNDWHRHQELADTGYRLTCEWLKRNKHNSLLDKFRIDG